MEYYSRYSAGITFISVHRTHFRDSWLQLIAKVEEELGSRTLCKTTLAWIDTNPIQCTENEEVDWMDQSKADVISNVQSTTASIQDCLSLIRSSRRGIRIATKRAST